MESSIGFNEMHGQIKGNIALSVEIYKNLYGPKGYIWNLSDHGVVAVNCKYIPLQMESPVTNIAYPQ